MKLDVLFFYEHASRELESDCYLATILKKRGYKVKVINRRYLWRGFLNPKVIILDFFEKNLSNNIVEYIKKLVYKLNKMYDKNIIICSNNIDIYLNIIKDIVIFDKGNIVYQGNDLYNSKIYKYIDEPNIVSFIKYLDRKGHKFDRYIDIKELLKAIYRDVENK